MIFEPGGDRTRNLQIAWVTDYQQIRWCQGFFKEPFLRNLEFIYSYKFYGLIDRPPYILEDLQLVVPENKKRVSSN